MADKNILMFFLILVLFISQVTAFSKNYNEGYRKDCSKNKELCSVEEIKAQILYMMGQFENTIHTREVQNKITYLIQLIKVTTSTQLESSLNKIENIQAIIFTTIILNLTQNGGKCSEGKEDELTALNTNIITNRNDCVTVYHNTGLDWLLNANITLTELQSNIATWLPIMFSTCLFESNQISDCLWKLLQTIKNWSIIIPNTINNIRHNSEKMAAEVTRNITNCVSISIATYVTEIINIVLVISQCEHPNANTCNTTNCEPYDFLNTFNPPDLTKAILKISNTVNVLNEQINSIKDTKDKQLANGMLSISKLFDEQVYFISFMKDLNNFSQDIDQCITNLTNEATSVMDSIFENLHQCQISVIKSIQDYIQIQIKKFENMLDNINNIPIELIGCFLHSSIISCIEQRIKKIDDVFVAANGVLGLTPEVMNGIMSLPKDLENCTTVAVAKATEYTSSLILLVTNCWNMTNIM